MRLLIHAGGLHQWRPTTPNCFWREEPSPAGTELNIYGMAQALADRGHAVTVVMPIAAPGEYGGAVYHRPEDFTLTHGAFDVIVSIHYAMLFTERFAPLQIVLAPSHHLLGIEQVEANVDRYMTPSRFGRRQLQWTHPTTNESKFWVTRCGDWLVKYDWKYTGDAWHAPDDLFTTHDPFHLVWASSPDRGLWHMVEILRLLGPAFRLTVAYNFDDFLKVCTHEPTIELLQRALPLRELPNVTFTNHLSQPALTQLLRTAGILVYPGDVPETYCMVANNACAAGLPAVLHGIGSLPEHYGNAAIVMPPVQPIDPHDWATAIGDLARNPPLYRLVQERQAKLAARTDFSSIAEEWETFFRDYPFNLLTDQGLAVKRSSPA